MPHQPIPVPMSFVETVLWFLVGMLISMVFPVVVKTLKSLRKKVHLEAKEVESPPTLTQRILIAWQQYGGNAYLGIMVFSILIAATLVFLLRLQFYDPVGAALAGIGWESLTNKLFSGQQSEAKSDREREQKHEAPA
jgi:hypothetical protein